YDHTVGFLKGGFDSWKKSGKEFETTKRITATELEKLQDTEKPLIIDVRKKSEYDSEHVIGAINVPLNEINQHLAQFPKDKRFVVHCAGGYRSMIASAILIQRGWDDFGDIVGGFEAISKTGMQRSEYVCPSTLL
ncbi:MAG: rhodanese-like domain-containing protein, partial [Maribacter sp.]